MSIKYMIPTIVLGGLLSVVSSASLAAHAFSCKPRYAPVVVKCYAHGNKQCIVRCSVKSDVDGRTCSVKYLNTDTYAVIRTRTMKMDLVKNVQTKEYETACPSPCPPPPCQSM